jgi:hypothetical protein
MLYVGRISLKEREKLLEKDGLEEREEKINKSNENEIRNVGRKK